MAFINRNTTIFPQECHYFCNNIIPKIQNIVYNSSNKLINQIGKISYSIVSVIK